jgi:2-polyprenyl-3-methyl-5-hydroxy-6-metoxy-1,4-benzoquinol methylase
MIKVRCTLIGMDINLGYADRGFQVFGSLDEINETFDVITMFDVLEHLDDETRNKYIAWINEHLRPGGYLIISTPNINNFYMLRWFWDNPEHKRPYTDVAIRRLFNNYDIRKKEIHPFVNPLKILRCWLAGTSFYTAVVYFMKKKVASKL